MNQRRGPGDLERWLPWAILVVAIGLFVWHASTSAFLQDDSYITYRYARNIVRGLGPVFNPGERVEGYTNFLWMMVMAVLGILGLPFTTIIPLSQVIGVVCGTIVMLLFFLLVRRHTTGPPLLASLAVGLLAASGSFAYWSVSGMETGLFTLLLAASFYFYLSGGPGRVSNRNLFLCSALLGLSALTRPEGVMFIALVVLHYLIVTATSGRRQLLSRRTLGHLALLVLPFAVLVLPLYVWRLSYYGYLFPNTFYAKTGVSASYVKSGIDYLVDFYKAYGLWGLAFFVPVVVAGVRRRLKPSSPLFFAALVILTHALYVISVGGDVLRIYRFFVPVMFLFYFLFTEGIWLLPLPTAVRTLVLLGLIPLTFFGPLRTPRSVRSDIQRNLMLEKGLVEKMAGTGIWLNEQLNEDEWFCCTTIGAVSYFADRNMIDMLGLTDETIAHHPEDILGGQLYWKERNYNTRYVLERNPKYVYFSTAIKPSAAAERALFLRPRFRLGYYACPFTFLAGPYLSTGTIYQARPDADTIPLEPLAPNPDFIAEYVHGINMRKVGLDTAMAHFRRCIELAPPDFGYAHEWLGIIYQELKNPDLAMANYLEAVARNDYCVTAHSQISGILLNRNLPDSAMPHLRKVAAYAPDFHESYINLSAVATQVGLYDEAVAALETATAKWPQLVELELRLGYTLIEAGDYDRAEDVLERLLRKVPNQQQARSLLQELARRRSRRTGSAPGS